MVINAALPVILGQLATLGQVRAGIDGIGARLAAVELFTEVNYAAGPPHGGAAAGAAAGARAGGVGAGTGLPPPGGPAADIAAAIAQGMAQARWNSWRGRGDGSSDENDDDAVDPARAFPGGQAKRVAKGRCGASGHPHFGASSSRSDLLISSVRRRNCPGNRPTAQPSPYGRRGSRQSPGGNRSPKHSWFYQTATETASPLSINPSPTRTPAAKVTTPNAQNR